MSYCNNDIVDISNNKDISHKMKRLNQLLPTGDLMKRNFPETFKNYAGRILCPLCNDNLDTNNHHHNCLITIDKFKTILLEFQSTLSTLILASAIPEDLPSRDKERLTKKIEDFIRNINIFKWARGSSTYVDTIIIFTEKKIY